MLNMFFCSKATGPTAACCCWAIAMRLAGRFVLSDGERSPAQRRKQRTLLERKQQPRRREERGCLLLRPMIGVCWQGVGTGQVCH